MATSEAAFGRSDRWLFLDGPNLAPIIEFDKICYRLRSELASEPESHHVDAPALALLDRALTIASNFEYNELLPRRMRRALDQMQHVITAWISRARAKGDMQHVDYYQQLADLTRPNSDSCQETYAAVDPYLVAERWYYLVTPMLTAHRRTHRREPFLLLDQITPKLIEQPFPDEALAEAFSELPELTPLAERVTACLLGITPEQHS